ncbi:MAG: fructose-6-phosphate aldolase [Chloroflexi bacterium]|nr:fructose-6-phosphate aldolase [Chloroflexota bacterium]
MQLFIDTADVAQIREARDWGIIDGVTTNPTHIANSGRPFDEVLKEIFDLVDGPISVESVSTNAEGIIAEGRRIAAFHKNAVVKVPIMIEGLKAVKVLASEGIHTNVTLVFSPLQAYLAAKAGATYVSPFIHRLDMVGHEGAELIRQIRDIYDTYGFETEIIAASIRNVKQVLDCLLAGSDIATMPFDMLKSLYQHPLTDDGLESFLKDWKRVPPSRLFATA